MTYIRKALHALVIRFASAGVGLAVETSAWFNFVTIELALIVTAAALLVITSYSKVVARFFPFFLIVKSGFDAVYVLTFAGTGLTAWLLIATNVVIGLLFLSDYLLNRVLPRHKHSRFAPAGFAVSYLIPLVTIFASIAAFIALTLFDALPPIAVLLYVVVNTCLLVKACIIFIQLQLLALGKHRLAAR